MGSPVSRVIAFVIGGADTAWSDLARARALAVPDLICACNHAARDLDGPVDHWATMHPDLLPHWAEQRRKAGRPDAGAYWTAGHRPAPIDVGRIPNAGGSSGLLTTNVALHLGATHVILCGIPMHQMNRHYDTRIPWREARQYHGSWIRSLPVLRGRVKSFGGHTLTWLGEPTEEWLHGNDAGTAQSAIG